MGNRFGYTINGPPVEVTDLPIRSLKLLSVRNEHKLGGNSLRNLYQHPDSPSDHQSSVSPAEDGNISQDAPALPLTPPMAEEEYHGTHDEASGTSELAKTRSLLTTPVNQPGPLTPENTPPREKPLLRPFLGAQPSMASTRAESFQTAHEDLSSDQDSAPSSPVLQAGRNYSSPRLPLHLTNGIHKPSPLANLPITNLDLASKESSPIIDPPGSIPTIDGAHNPTGRTVDDRHLINDLDNEAPVTDAFPIRHPVQLNNRAHSGISSTIGSRKEGMRRGRSLRERLEDSQQASRSPSMDKFASIIGWSKDVRSSADSQRRWSGVSNTSTVEAFLIEAPRIPKKRNTLRHVSKNESLRSASSPLPISNRTSMQSSSDSPHRLVHKRAKIGNHNRLSFGSEMSQPLSFGSNPVSKVEVIKVAIIPERSSSLQQSVVSSRRPSLSTTGAPTSFRKPRSSDGSQRKRALTDTTERSRDRYYPPQVPPRAASLSAPTSRNTSRANSITSDHVRFERKRAEKDLRSTLERMESERLASSLKSESVDIVLTSTTAEEFQTTNHGYEEHTDKPRVQDSLNIITPGSAHAIPGSKEWAELRRASMLHTPFSQPSFMSASPEISEARIISLHVHNNHSVQLIEPFPLNESGAVGEARKLNQKDFENVDILDSPLRNPRHPPHPPAPQFHVIPATPRDELQVQLGDNGRQEPTQPGPVIPHRPAAQPRTDSFAKNLLRNVSLKNARNKKADQELDSTLHPFWRPRPFWDGIEPVSPEKKKNNEDTERGVVNNSLGLPQQRLVVPGPLALVRKLSERRRNGKLIAKQTSYSSLHRLRTGRKIYRLPGLGMHLHFMSLKDIQEGIHTVRQRRADEKRERRREALRKSIGANVIATGDSRFPAALIEEDLQR